jgi:hypothetical protein
MAKQEEFINPVPDMTPEEVEKMLSAAVANFTVARYFSLVRNHPKLAEQFNQVSNTILDLQNNFTAITKQSGVNS